MNSLICVLATALPWSEEGESNPPQTERIDTAGRDNVVPCPEF